jgi:hypothetical protein
MLVGVMISLIFMNDNRESRFRLRFVLITIILATVPCYCTGLALVRFAGGPKPAPPTSTPLWVQPATLTAEAATALVPSFTPIFVTATFYTPPAPSWTPTDTNTPPPATLTPTPTTTPSPTPYPSDTPTPTPSETLPPTVTFTSTQPPYPVPADTALPPP